MHGRTFMAMLVVAGSGCASVKIYPISNKVGLHTQLPTKIMVGGFSIIHSPHAKNTNPEDQICGIIRETLAEELRKHGHDVVLLNESEHQPKSSERGSLWLVSGNLSRIVEGRRSLRVVMGLGAGKSELDTSVRVFEIPCENRMPLLELDTAATSGSKPGILLIPPTGPAALIGAGVQGAMAFRTGVHDDARRTAKKIASYLSSQLENLPGESL